MEEEMGLIFGFNFIFSFFLLEIKWIIKYCEWLIGWLLFEYEY